MRFARYGSVVTFFVVLLCHAPSFAQSIDPLGCTNLSDNQLNLAGYETVRSHGAVGNGANDDTVSIQAAIDAALTNRRMVYFHPGDYLIRDTLQVRQELYRTNGNGDSERFGITLIGSYCGSVKPTIRFPSLVGDDHAKETDPQKIALNPKPVILLMREQVASGQRAATVDRQPTQLDDVADDSESSRDWNQIVKNLTIVTGPNSGVVGIRHLGAEGSAAQDVTIDATGAFAGFYYVNSSGGYTYNIEVIGGKYGLFIPFGRGGAMVIAGLKMRNQTDTPIVVNHYAPMTLVAADIQHDDGNIIGGLQGNTVISELKGSQPSGGHLSLIDGQIEITDTNTIPIFNNTLLNVNRGGRSVYMKNMYFKTPNTKTVLENGAAGDLLMTGGSNWHHVTEYNSSANFDTLPNQAGGETKLIRGVTTEETYYDDPQCGTNQLCDRTIDLTIGKQVTTLPIELQSQHFYADALCNVEANGTVFVAPIGAGQSLDPSITDGTGAIAEDVSGSTEGDDRNAIQNAIDLAAQGSKRVFIPGGEAFTDSNEKLVKLYTLRGTLNLTDDVHLCGASRSTSILSAGRNGSSAAIRDNDRWQPSVNSPLIRTENDVDSKVVLGDLSLHVPRPDSSGVTVSGYTPYVYSLHWRSGQHSTVKDVWWKHDFGDPGERVSAQINDNGGGRWYGITQQNGYPPRFVNGIGPVSGSGANPNTDPENQSFYHYQTGELVLSPNSKHMLIDGTTEPLAFYPFHCQHITLPFGSQCDIVDATNVTLYGIKQEAASTPETIAAIILSNLSNPAIVPIWMRIKDSHNINLFGYESHSEYAQGRAKIEISGDNSNITIANMAARNFADTVFPTDQWYFVKETVNGGDNIVSVQSQIMPLFKSVNTPVESNDELCVPLKSLNGKIVVICL